LGRLLGIDLGARWVGLALTDPQGIIASPLETIPLESESSLVRRIVDFSRKKGVDRVVIGLPLSADGSEGPGCARSRRIADRLSEEGVVCELHDESWSSREAEEALRSTGRTRKAARSRVDSVAASLILQDYLASRPQS